VHSPGRWCGIDISYWSSSIGRYNNNELLLPTLSNSTFFYLRGRSSIYIVLYTVLSLGFANEDLIHRYGLGRLYNI